MRYLNKIVFINSANIKYAEICLDGNVHFIGTQGVGKSTVLRAILFFYNANKQKLGIKTQQKQKPFDEFYLPNPNSYIIYEVTRENGKFFVVAFRTQGRAAFRFVDCAYDPRFFIDDSGRAEYEWGKISKNIGKPMKSNIIYTRQLYLDTLYGNINNVDREMRRFSIMESTKYQNVPRSIQNIFLNQKLDSQVIKNIIIDSMDFSESNNIDLNTMRTELKDFRMQYDDIGKWFKKEKNGKVKVRSEADRVIDVYGKYEACRKIIVELTGHIVYAYNRDREELPKNEGRLNEADHLLAGKRQEADDEAKNYSKQRDALNREEGALTQKLEDTRRKRQHYAEIGIDNIIEKISHENELNIRRGSLSEQLGLLTGKNKDVKEKYDTLRRNVSDACRQRLSDCQSRITKMTAEENDEKAALNKKYVADAARIDDDYHARQLAAQKQCEDLQREIADLKLAAERIKTANPFAAQMDEDNKNIKKLEADSMRLQKTAAQKQREADRLTHEAEMRQKELETAAEKDIMKTEQALNDVNEQMNALSKLLERSKGSFIEWLENNAEGWENNIGKIADEETVLYNTALNPVKADGSDTLFGIKIDTGGIDRTVRTPADILREKTELEKKASALKDAIVKRREALSSEKEQDGKKTSLQLRQLRAELRDIDAELQSIPSRIKAAERDCAALADRLDKYREERTSENMHKLDDAVMRLQRADEKRDSVNDEQKNQKKKLAGAFEAAQKEISAGYAGRRAAVEAEKKNIEAETEKHLKELDALMDRDLRGLGVDMQKIETLRRQIAEIDGKLSFINKNRDSYTYWKRDKAELFDNEQANKDNLDVLRRKLAELDSEYAARRKTLDEAVKSLSADCRRLAEMLRNIREDIAEAEEFMNSSSWPAEYADDNGIETVKALRDILKELRDRLMLRGRLRDEFVSSIKQFNANFSQQNTFHFKTDLNTDSDYMNFAANLSEFIVNDKIESYRKRVSEHYASFLRTLSRETGELLKNKSEVQKTVMDINRDFRENNFVGAIKDIELRISESSNPIINHLNNIKKFTDENGDSLGVLDLFSDENRLAQNNKTAVRLLSELIDRLDADQKCTVVTLADAFRLEFRVQENDNDTGWVEQLANVGSDGTDVLVKAMVNIMLLNVFKKKVSKRFGDFRLHCMMDEIGKLHPDNVKGILDFANKRNIYLVNSSPTTYNATAYKYTYSLSKDSSNITMVKKLMAIL